MPRVLWSPPPHEDPWLRRLEAWTLRLEAGLFALVREAWWFVFYHSGTLAFWTLVLLVATGLYVTLFYRYGLEAAYTSIIGLDAQGIGRWVRSAHRYLADLLLVFTALHAWRMLVQQRFKGPRRWAWAAGVGLVVLTWATGVTGFWLLADVRARWLHTAVLQALGPTGWVPGWWARLLFPAWAEDRGWLYTAALFAAHVLLTGLMGVFYWWHIRHLQRPRWLPPRAWWWTTAGAVLLLSVLAPVLRQPFWSEPHTPPRVPLNALYLGWLPAALEGRGIGWLLALLALAVLAALPWWWFPRRRPRPVQLDPQACIGCTLCARDCPYLALEMVPRAGPGTPWVAHLWPERCVGCGVCVGSCPTDALYLPFSLGDGRALRTHVREAVQALGARAGTVVFACYRHVACEHLREPGSLEAALPPDTALLAVPCVGVLHPDVVAEAWRAGAHEVRVVGCPPEDCPERFGQVWLEARLRRRRKPWLRFRWKGRPLRWHWVPPSALRAVLQGRYPAKTTTALVEEAGMDTGWWRSAPWPALVAMWAVLLLSLWALNRWGYTGPTWSSRATLELWVRAPRGLDPAPGEQPLALELWVDGRRWEQAAFAPPQPGTGRSLFWQVLLPPGLRQVTLYLVGPHDHGRERRPVATERRFWKRGHVYPYRISLDARERDPAREPGFGNSAGAARGGVPLDWSCEHTTRHQGFC